MLTQIALLVLSEKTAQKTTVTSGTTTRRVGLGGHGDDGQAMTSEKYSIFLHFLQVSLMSGLIKAS